MQQLNLPEYEFKIKTDGNIKQIFDPIRKKYLVLTPEEWVRQNFIQYLIHELEIPASHIGVENATSYNKLRKRSDILVSNQSGKVAMLVECKATSVKITQKTFDQIALYNNQRVEYLVVTNGLNHYCCQFVAETNSYHFVEIMPKYNKL